MNGEIYEMTRNEISNILNIPVTEVTKIENTALRKLKNRFNKVYSNVKSNDLEYQEDDSLWQQYVSFIIKN